MAAYKNNTGVKYTLRDIYGVPLIMPEELSKLICDFARVRVPDEGEYGESSDKCAICFGKRANHHKPEGYRYCKGCYQQYTGNGGYTKKNDFSEFKNCIKCSHKKHSGYKNCPLCVTCYNQLNSEIYEFKGQLQCGCGRTKQRQFAFCYPCNKMGKYEEAKHTFTKTLGDIIEKLFPSYLPCQLGD